MPPLLAELLVPIERPADRITDVELLAWHESITLATERGNFEALEAQGRALLRPAYAALDTGGLTELDPNYDRVNEVVSVGEYLRGEAFRLRSGVCPRGEARRLLEEAGDRLRVSLRKDPRFAPARRAYARLRELDQPEVTHYEYRSVRRQRL
jgi:hypothetical protein